MAKDPAFLFYPGDYLRDTQTLSENSQVAYDRIMCEHMRNICISKRQLKFFTKKLNEEELDELMFVLTEVEHGFQIQWVAESIIKRKAYSESRRNNRKKKNTEKTKDISVSYDKHMENEIESEDESEDSLEGVQGETFEKLDPDKFTNVGIMGKIRIYWESQRGLPWKPEYMRDASEISKQIRKIYLSQGQDPEPDDMFELFKAIAESTNWHIVNNFSLQTINQKFPQIITQIKNENNGVTGKTTGHDIAVARAQAVGDHV